MAIDVLKAEYIHLADCRVALQNSELGRIYFPNEDKANQAINEGITKQEISVVIYQKQVVGFMWIIPNGAFHSFPYLHIIAVKEEYRNAGIGKKMLKYIDETWLEQYSKVFLVVADFNISAKNFYLNNGYKEVGYIPSLYKKGVTEFLMMKEIL